MSSLYLHIPFCVRKCNYCSFSSTTATEKERSIYLDSLKRELLTISTTVPLQTIFIGGGTPTSLQVTELAGLISFIKENFEISKTCEISVEANPGTVDMHYFDTLLGAGVNRLSLGIQSFNDEELTKLGRLHTSKEAFHAVTSAKAAGFSNINIDLMYGLPGQDLNTWKNSLEYALSLSPQHLSLYQLMVEEGTHFGRLDAAGELSLPDEDEILQMDGLTRKLTIAKKLEQYETSNYSLKGYECRHNINYWENDNYYAAGASAVSFLGGLREKRIEDHAQYCKEVLDGNSPIAESERLSREASFRETVIMGLRMIRGVDLQKLRLKYQMDPAQHYASTLTALIDAEMVELTRTHLSITRKGAMFANKIMAELV